MELDLFDDLRILGGGTPLVSVSNMMECEVCGGSFGDCGGEMSSFSTTTEEYLAVEPIPLLRERPGSFALSSTES